MNIRKEYYKNLANTVMKGFQKRFIESYYCETATEAKMEIGTELHTKMKFCQLIQFSFDCSLNL